MLVIAYCFWVGGLPDAEVGKLDLNLDSATFCRLGLGKSLIVSECRPSCLKWAVVMFESTIQGFFFVE